MIQMGGCNKPKDDLTLTYFSTSLFLLRIFMVLLSSPRNVKPYLQVETNGHGSRKMSQRLIRVRLSAWRSSSQRLDDLPHGPFHQCDLIWWGSYKASLFLLWLGYVSICNDAVHLVNVILVALTLLCGLLHLDRVAETERTQKQLLPLLNKGLENQAITNHRLTNCK